MKFIDVSENMTPENAHILVIHENSQSGEALIERLRKLGHTVTPAAVFSQQKSTVSETTPDIVFLALESRTDDWRQVLPELTGSSPAPPVIAFGQNLSAGDVRMAFQMGAFDCLPHHLPPDEDLTATIERAFDAAARPKETHPLSFSLEEKLAIEQHKRINAENIAREFQKTFQIMFENTNEAIIQFDRQGLVANANTPLFDIFGIKPREVIGRNIGEFDFLGPEYMQAIELYKAATPETVFPVFEVEAFHKNGEKIYLETRARPLLNQGEIEGIINIVRNISPQKRLENTKNATILGLAKLAESRDDNTGRHLERIREYVKIIAQALRRLPRYKNYITAAYINDIDYSSILHDIGKVGTPDAILLKPGPLTEEEFEMIKQHTIMGGNALAAIDAELEAQSFLTLAKEIAYYHHESWNGSGYPEGLKGEEIPLSARIVALADVYDALTTARPYKEAYSHEKAVNIILQERGTKFDPDIVDAFQETRDRFDYIRRRNQDESDRPGPEQKFRYCLET